MKNWKHIITDSPQDIEIGKHLAVIGQKVKSIHDTKTHSVDLALYENKFSITLISEEPFISTIESEPLSLSMRGIFDIIWKTGKWVK